MWCYLLWPRISKMKGLSEHRVFKIIPLLSMYVWGRKCGVYRGTLNFSLCICLCVPRQNFPSEIGLAAVAQLSKVSKQSALLPDYTNWTFRWKCQEAEQGLGGSSQTGSLVGWSLSGWFWGGLSRPWEVLLQLIVAAHNCGVYFEHKTWAAVISSSSYGLILSSRLLGTCAVWDWGSQDTLRLDHGYQYRWAVLSWIETSELLCASFCLKRESQDSLGGNSTTWNQHFVQILGWYTGELLVGGHTSRKVSEQFCLVLGFTVFVLFSYHSCWFGVMREVEGWNAVTSPDCWAQSHSFSYLEVRLAAAGH